MYLFSVKKIKSRVRLPRREHIPWFIKASPSPFHILVLTPLGNKAAPPVHPFGEVEAVEAAL